MKDLSGVPRPVDIHLIEPDRAQDDECRKAFICLVATGCDASELFEIAEEGLNEMPPAIHGNHKG